MLFPLKRLQMALKCIQGLRGRRTSSYQVWSTDATGQVTRKSSWLNAEALAQQGYASAYTTTPDIDPSVALPAVSASSDANSDGFVDGLGYYMLMGETLSSAVDFTDSRGKRLTPNTSRNWNAVASEDVGDGFEVLIKGLGAAVHRPIRCSPPMPRSSHQQTSRLNATALPNRVMRPPSTKTSTTTPCWRSDLSILRRQW